MLSSGFTSIRERLLTCSFDLLLTGYAVSRPRYGFQSLGIDLTSTSQAEAETAVADARECLLDHAEQLFFVCALPKQKIFGIRARSPVDNVRSHGIVDSAAGFLFLGDTSTQILLAGLQPFFELLQALLVHKPQPRVAIIARRHRM